MKHLFTLVALLMIQLAYGQVTHELEVEDDEFDPPFLTINIGDHVHIIWDEDASPSHTFTQVSPDTWAVNGTVPLSGGFQLGEGTPSPGTDFTITPTADVWYVCEFHAFMGMKGTITVLGATGVETPTLPDLVRLALNPGGTSATVFAPDDLRLMAVVTDMTGRTVAREQLGSGRLLRMDALPVGLYVADFRSMDATLLARQKFVVAR